MSGQSYEPYAEYKESRRNWLREIPSHWSACSLKFLSSERVKDGPHETPNFVDNGIPFFSVDGIQDNELVLEGCRFISESDHERYSQKCRPVTGDVLLGKAASVGKVAHVQLTEPFNVWSPLAVIRPQDERMGRFIFYALQSAYLQAQCLVQSNSNTQNNLSMRAIDNLYFPAPSVEEQTQIAKFLDYETAKIDALIEKQQQLIALLKEKRQAVISHAVTKGLNPAAPMRDSGVEWIGKIPAHWESVRVRDVGKVDQGCAFSHSIQGQETGELPWFKVKDMNRDGNGVEMHTADNYIDIKLAEAIRATIFPEDTVIFPRVGAALLTNKRRILRGRAILDDNIYGVIPTLIEPRFLLHVLSLVDMARICSAGLVPTVTFSAIKEIRLPLPPRAEQEEIVKHVEHLLNKLSALEAKAEAATQLLQERRTSLISAAVTGTIDVRGWKAPDSAAEPEVA